MHIHLRVQIGSPSCSPEGKYAVPLTIGRQDGTGVFVVRDDRKVSSLHCLVRVEHGRIVVENRSQNGSLVGDFPLMTVGGCHILQPGQTLQVGETVLELSLIADVGSVAANVESTHRAPLDAEHTLTALSTRKSAGAIRGNSAGSAVAASGTPPAFIITEELPGALGRRWGGDLRLTASSITFGRIADVLLDDLTISRQHFRLHRTSGGLDVEGVVSAHSVQGGAALNGIRLNGRRVIQRQPVKDRDVLQAGPFTLTVNLVGQDVLLRVRGLEHEVTQEATLVARAIGTGSAEQPQHREPLASPEGTLVVVPNRTEPKDGELRKRAASRWVPTSDLRHDSWLKGLVTATGLGVLLFVLVGAGARGHGLFSPGPLSEVHQSMTGGDCASCHLPGKTDVSLGCLQSACHANAALPLPPEAQDGLPVPMTGIHLSVGEETAAHPDLPLACNACHVEHRPDRVALRSPPASRCLECHSSAHEKDGRFAELEPLERTDLRCTACHIQHPRGQEPTVRDEPVTAALLATAPDPMESTAGEGASLLTVLGGLSLAFSPPVGYGLWRWRRRKRLSEKVQVVTLAAERQGLPGPPKPQIPHVDPLKCVGCRACVDACPFDALDLVDGIAKLVSRPACHGVAICAEVCPTGAISMAATDVSPHQAPINDDFESVLNPGIFLVGDLSGLSLIKNAINTGVLAAETIHKRPRPSGCDVDVAIVGAGPSGLSAGLRSAELGLRYVLLEQGSVANTLRHFPRSKLVFAQPFDVPLLGKVPMAECTKEQLLAMWDALIVRHGLKVNENEKVLSVARRLQGGFEVTTTQRTYTAAHVVLAIGKRGTPRRLGAVGEDSEKVLYNLVDAEHYKGKKAFVFGAGDVALETALALAGQKGTEVTLGYRGDKIDMAKKRNVDKLNAAAAAGKLRVRPGVSKVIEIRPQEIVIETLEGLVVLPNDVVFACIGAEMPTAWLKSIGVMA